MTVKSEAIPALVRDEGKMVVDAVDWVVGQCPDGACPFDGARLDHAADEASAREALRQHLMVRHQVLCLSAFQQKTLEPSLEWTQTPPVVEEEPADEGDYWSLGGLTRIDDIDRPDALYVPREYARSVQKEGGSLRWAAPEKVARYRDLGAKAVRISETTEPGALQGSTEDGIVKSNEMVLMHFPSRLTERRRQQKQRAIDKGLYARKQERDAALEGGAKRIRDAMTSKGIDSDTAAQVARAIISGAETDQSGFRFKDDRAHEGVFLEDQTGKKRLD